MSSINKVILVGRLGKDPETKFMNSGEAVCNINLATSESWKDKSSGEKKTKTEWHNVVLYKNNAEIAGKYLRKGALIGIEGKNTTRKYTDKNGVEKYIHEVIASDMKMLDSKGASGNQDKGKSEQDGNGFEDMDDKIPF